MNRQADMDSEWKRLMNGVRDESLTTEEFATLEGRLRDSPADRKDYLCRMQMHGLLELFPPQEVNSAGVGTHQHRKVDFFPTGWKLFLPMVAVTAIVLGGFLWLSTQKKPTSPSSIATLLLAENCLWEGKASRLFEGQVLSSGPLKLTRGSAVLRFDGGAEMILEGMASVDLVSANRVYLHHGNAVIRAGDGTEPFTVSTPEGELIDLGTEFAVQVEDSGATELHVHEGEVVARDSIITAGKAIRLEHEGRQKRQNKVALNAPRFSEALARTGPRERRDLMWVYEGFDVVEGTYRNGDLNGGKGWTGPWRERTPGEFGNHGPDTIGGMIISHGQMEVTWPVKGGRKGMLEMPAGRIIRVRQLKKPVYLNRDGVVYISFLAAEKSAGANNTPSDNEKLKKRDDLRLTFRSSEDYFGKSISLGWSKKRIPRVQAADAGLQRALREIPEDETVFCIAKLILSENKADRIYFRFYREKDDLDVLEPAEWDIVMGDVNLDAKLDLLLVTSTGNRTRYVDEIRIGPSWRSVTPLNMQPRSR